MIVPCQASPIYVVSQRLLLADYTGRNDDLARIILVAYLVL